MIVRTAQNPLISKVWRYFLNVGIFALLLYLIFEQVFQYEGRGSQWQAIVEASSRPLILLILPAALLLPLNWGLEVKKWQILIRSIKQLSVLEAWKHVLTGVAAGFITPNRIGEHVGRIYPLPAEKRVYGLSRNIQGSFAQVIVTLLCGLTAIFFLRELNFWPLTESVFWIALPLGLMAILIVCLLFFCWSDLPKLLPSKLYAWISRFISLNDQHERVSTSLLLTILTLSLLRFSVYLGQYILICSALGMQFSLALSFSIAAIFFFQTLSPGLALADLGIRGNLALLFLGPFCPHPIIPLAAALLIWVMNLVIPSLVGGLLIFSNRHRARIEYQGQVGS